MNSFLGFLFLLSSIQTNHPLASPYERFKEKDILPFYAHNFASNFNF